MTKNQKALAWGCLPGIVVVLNFVLYPLSTFLFQMGGANGFVRIFKMVFMVLQSIVGIAAMIMVPVGIVMAIIVATNKDDESKTPPPNQNA